MPKSQKFPAKVNRKKVYVFLLLWSYRVMVNLHVDEIRANFLTKLVPTKPRFANFTAKMTIL